jgi:hypothetical protein
MQRRREAYREQLARELETHLQPRLDLLGKFFQPAVTDKDEEIADLKEQLLLKLTKLLTGRIQT